MGLARCPSSRTNYQLKWSVYRSWCHKDGHSISLASLPKIADFLFWLHRSKGLSISSLLGYHSMLAAVFRTAIPSIFSDPVLRNLIRSFKVEAPPPPVRPPAWDLSMVLRCLNTPLFEPLHLRSLRNITKKILFLVALATAKHVGELQAISRTVSFVSSDACLSYVLEFVAKTRVFFQSPSSPFLGEISVRFCCRSGGRFVTLPCQSPPHLPSQDTLSLLFTSPIRLSSPCHLIRFARGYS